MRKLSLRKYLEEKISTRSTSQDNWTNSSAFSLEHRHSRKIKHKQLRMHYLWSKIKIMMEGALAMRVKMRISVNAKANTSRKLVVS